MSKDELVITTQLTSKKYKRRSMYCLIVMVVCVLTILNGEPEYKGAAFLGVFGTLVAYLINRVMAWYNHG